ncbi:MAG: uroporphyrinogen decarboxylase family protein [FCB group bacterium]|nr:uroporphyrinogen decarboxylase family protein [FCB group bacterium]
MDRKSIVKAAIERTGPPRTPITYCNRDFEFSDVLSGGFDAPASFTPSTPGLSEWGYVWQALDDTMGQPHENPLADASRLADYTPPDPHAPGRFAPLEKVLEESGDRFIKFGLGITGFNQATFLRGFETFLMDLYADPEMAARVLDIVFDFENGLIDQAVQYPIDAVAFGDDWGTQEGLMISTPMWRQIFRPRYEAQFARIRAAGKKVWFHSCGNVYDIIGDLIDIGVDVIELLQPDLLGVKRLAREFGGKVCFCCSVDHQRRAVSGTRDEIFAYARYLRDNLGAYNGGFIAYIEDYASLGMSEANYQAIREAFHSLDA